MENDSKAGNEINEAAALASAAAAVMKLSNEGILGKRKYGDKDNNSNVCDWCGDTFDSVSELRAHVAMKHNGSRFNCIVCHKSFNRKYHLETHIRAIHIGERFKCDFCDKQFTRKSDVNRHCKSFHSENCHNCPSCKRIFHNKDLLEEHIVKVHENVRWKCEVCDKQFSYKASLVDHLKWNHGGDYACDFCDSIFEFKGQVSAHMKEVHANATYPCFGCRKPFHSKDNLIKHLVKVHQIAVDPEKLAKDFCCLHCFSTFDSAKDLISHRKIHSGDLFIKAITPTGSLSHMNQNLPFSPTYSPPILTSGVQTLNRVLELLSKKN